MFFEDGGPKLVNPNGLTDKKDYSMGQSMNHHPEVNNFSPKTHLNNGTQLPTNN